MSTAAPFFPGARSDPVRRFCLQWDWPVKLQRTAQWLCSSDDLFEKQLSKTQPPSLPLSVESHTSPIRPESANIFPHEFGRSGRKHGQRDLVDGGRTSSWTLSVVRGVRTEDGARKDGGGNQDGR